MEIRDYGTTGAKATALGLGGAFLTHHSFADGVATVRKALDLGITYFDTSPMYCQGASQAVLGEALDGVDGDFLLATKLGYFTEPSRFHFARGTHYSIRRKPAPFAPQSRRHPAVARSRHAPLVVRRSGFIGLSSNSAEDMTRVLQNTTVDTFFSPSTTTFCATARGRYCPSLANAVSLN